MNAFVDIQVSTAQKPSLGLTLLAAHRGLSKELSPQSPRSTDTGAAPPRGL